MPELFTLFLCKLPYWEKLICEISWTPPLTLNPIPFLNIYKGLKKKTTITWHRASLSAVTLLSCYCSPGYFNSEIHLVSSLFVAWAFLIFLLTMPQRISKGFGSGVGVVWPVKHSKTKSNNVTPYYYLRKTAPKCRSSVWKTVHSVDALLLLNIWE